MTLTAISCIKNESDLVEAFVRHTLAVADRLVVLDNGSTDGTRQVLSQLAAEGLALEIVDDATLLNPALRIRHRLASEGIVVRKVIAPRHLAASPDVRLAQGSHFVADLDGDIEADDHDRPAQRDDCRAHRLLGLAARTPRRRAVQRLAASPGSKGESVAP